MFRDGAERLLVFRVGHERFAVRLAAVDEVIDAPPIQPLPDAPANALGITSIRDALVSVFDPRVVLQLEAAPPEFGAVLLFERGARRVGLAIADVYDAVLVESGDVLPAPGSQSADGILLGVVRRGAELIGILDVDALLDAAIAVQEGETT
jgi:chemotaxis signal transduction protein